MLYIDGILGFDAKKAERAVQKYQVISFDIFDTLIRRNVSSPAQILDIAEMRYNLSNTGKTIHGFRKLRIAAERTAREENPSREITFEEIYQKLALTANWGESGVLSDLMNIEAQTEIDYCEPNIPVRNVFQQCLLSGKRVILVSDMYLPEAIVEKMLAKCGIAGYERLYLSSTIGKQKITGELFDYVMNDLAVKAKNILHFGDRKKADNLMPRSKGMRSFYVEPVILNSAFLTKKDLLSSQTPLFAFINNRLPRYGESSNVFRWGYEAFGPLLLGFAAWVHEQITARKIEHAYFLARDMNLVFQVYRKIYGESGTSYLEVSRASLRNEYVIKKNYLSSVFDTMMRGKYTVREVLERLRMDNENDIYSLTCVSPHDDIVPGAETEPHFLSLSRCVVNRLKSKENYIAEYLDQNGLFAERRSAIVDIGWHGTIQNMLETITGKKLTGLYFGNTKRSSFPDMDIFGYWFSEADERRMLPYFPMIYILEVMLFNNIGTVVGYKKDAGTVSPVYGNCEMTDFSMIEEFQKGAMQFIEDYTAFEPQIPVIPAEAAAKAYKTLAFYPTLAQAKKFSELPFENGIVYNLAKARSLAFYFFHPHRLIIDYTSALWKEGFIKQVLPFLRNPYRADMIMKRIITIFGINRPQLHEKDKVKSQGI